MRGAEMALWPFPTLCAVTCRQHRPLHPESQLPSEKFCLQEAHPDGIFMQRPGPERPRRIATFLWAG